MWVSVVVQQIMLLSAFLGCILLVLASLSDIIRTSQEVRTKQKRARHRHITVLLDARHATKVDITATLASLVKCRYAQYDVVVLAQKRWPELHGPQVKFYYPKAATTDANCYTKAYARSQKGEYVVYAQAGAQFAPTLLQTINRRFHFSARTQRIILQEDISTAGLEQFHRIIGTTIVQELQKAGTLLPSRLPLERKFYAARYSLPTTGKQEVVPNAFTKNHAEQSGWSWLVGVVFVAFATVIVGQYLMLGYTAQLLAGILFMATLSVVLALLQQSTARRTLLLFSPSALFVLPVTILVSAGTALKQQK